MTYGSCRSGANVTAHAAGPKHQLGAGQMSRNQWAITTVLALAVALVFGCFGVYLYTYLTVGVSPDMSAAVQPAHMDTDSPAGASAGSPAVGAADYGYRLCFQDVAAGSTELMEDLDLVASIDTEGPLDVCETLEGLGLQRRAAEMRTCHQDCPAPSDPHLQAARRYLDSGLAETIEAGNCIDRYCADTLNASWLGEASAHLERARQLESLAGQEMRAYYNSY